VTGRPISKSSYEHWLSVEQALGVAAGAAHRALGYLITAVWLEDEAAARGISVSQTQVRQRLAELERNGFPKPGAWHAFLARSHESEADLLGRVRGELLQSDIAAQVAGSRAGAQRSSLLASFQQGFQRRWKDRTTCGHAYVMEDCSEYKGAPEGQAVTSSAGGSGASSSSAASPSGSSSGAEVQPGSGGMTITSSAFEANGTIPAQYTCVGSDVSPPLQWQHVPAKAAALVLIIIDDSSTGSASGIRWMVGDISPSAKGVAAGATPQGGIVGDDTQGHSGYGGICPEHGKTSRIEFVLYALRKKIALSPGFEPALAESEYGQGHDLLGSAAVTYAAYHRP
jgi:phosphatidylethanolamine-binding protein (PEBP) family uncharacterized protein